MKVARFLVHLLAEHFDRRHVEADKKEQVWRKEMEEFEETLPDPEERTVEQWKRLVYLTGELYYAMAASSNMTAATLHVERLTDALGEVEDE